jgi:hypothetical protein
MEIYRQIETIAYQLACDYFLFADHTSASFGLELCAKIAPRPAGLLPDR